jgi:hypothetical protein
MQRILVVTLALCLSLAQMSQAQWEVSDSGALAQRAAIWAQEALQWAQSLANQAKEIEAQYNIILNQIKQIEWMVEQSQRIPEGLNLMQDMSLFSSRLLGLMSTAGGLSFNLEQATSSFTTFYKRTLTITQTPEVLAARTQFLANRMQAAQLAVQTQAIQTHLSEMASKMCALLSGAWTAHGALDSAQIAAQQRALLMAVHQQTQATAAAAQRLEAQHQAEEIVQEQLDVEATQSAFRDKHERSQVTLPGAVPRLKW